MRRWFCLSTEVSSKSDLSNAFRMFKFGVK